VAIPELASFSDQPELPLIQRRIPVGAECQPAGVHFRVWAPAARSIAVVMRGGCRAELVPAGDGYFSALLADAVHGAQYSIQIDNGPRLLPDPASRFQPAGPDGPSQVVDPQQFAWEDQDWPGVSTRGQVLYEMHVGTFTPEGTWNAAAKHLTELAVLGITTIELLPIAEFPGRFGWGYDVANLFAPTSLYGTPDELRSFVNEAHRLGIGVLLDVVYNHVGSVGEGLLRPFSPNYFSRRHKTDWGAAVNFDDADSAEVREFILANVRYWIREFHFDGLRVDATQSMHDDSPRDILRDICRTAREAAGERSLLILGENEPQRTELLRDAEAGGYEFDALWNDDFHHAAMVRLTGHNEAYYTDYRGTAEEFIASAQWGFLFQGQRYNWQDNPRGSPALDIAGHRFINYLQNHDQVANSARGERVHQITSPGRYRAMTALLLLTPQTPLLFQGQEFAASTPFLYFNDCGPDENDQVRRGRAEFLAQFRTLGTEAMRQRLVDPCDPVTFMRSKLDHSERERHVEAYTLHCDLLRLRREDATLSRQIAAEVRGATLAQDAFFLRYFPPNGDTRLLIVNFDRDLRLPSIPHPLIAPPADTRWVVVWSSENPVYGGSGTADLETSEGWRIPGESAVLLKPQAGYNNS